MITTISIENDISELEKLNHFLDQLSDHWELNAKTRMELNLVLEELVSNIIFYAYNNSLKHYILISCIRNDNVLEIKIVDDGKPFDPVMAETSGEIDKPAGEREIGGLGIHFVKTLTDEINYSRIDQKNILVLKKMI